MRRHWWIPLAATGLVLLAGCIGQLGDLGPDDEIDTDAANVDWHVNALPSGDDHEHTARAQHEGLTTPNFDVVGFNPLISPHYDAPAGSYFCGDAMPTRDDRTLAVVESRSDVAFAIADVTDPEQPKWLGELVMETTHVYDLGVAPDGEHVILATSNVRGQALPSTPLQDASTGMEWHSACNDGPVPVTAASEEDPVPRPMSLILVNIADPEQPEIVQQTPLAGNGHSIFIDTLQGEDWVMVTTSRTPSPQGPPGISHSSISAYEFYRLQETPEGATLEPVSKFTQPPREDNAENQPLGPRGHDGWMQVHPATGDLTAYLAGGDRFTILDMSNPQAPEEIARWHPDGPGTVKETGGLHSAWATEELWDGRHFTIIGPEHHERPDPYPTGILWAFDTTDPTDPQLVAAWTMPADAEWNGTFMFSNHYFTGHGETLFVSQYHGGMWAVDLSPLTETDPNDDELLMLESVGVFMPDHEPAQEAAVQQRWAPTLEEALAMPDGTIVTFDGNAGVYTVSFDEEQPIPAPDPWPIHDPQDWAS